MPPRYQRSDIDPAACPPSFFGGSGIAGRTGLEPVASSVTGVEQAAESDFVAQTDIVLSSLAMEKNCRAQKC